MGAEQGGSAFTMICKSARWFLPACSLLGILALPLNLVASQGNTQTGSTGSPAVSLPGFTTATVDLGLGLATTQQEGVSVPISNPYGSAVQVLGAQASGDLFIESFPATIPAKGGASLTALYYSTGATSGGTDIVRLLTSAGPII